MSKENNGGPAFPAEEVIVRSKIIPPSQGMTLRDYFAAQAIQAIIIGNEADTCVLGIGAAKDAYLVADAMLEARDK